MKLVSRYSKKSRVITPVGEKSRTHQSFKAECDINNIMLKYKTQGTLPNLGASIPRYGDFTQVQDYQTALNSVIAAQDAFSALPAKIRSRFANDPGLFLAFVEDPSNRDELIRMGLATPKTELAEGKPEGADKPAETKSSKKQDGASDTRDAVSKS